MFSVVVTVWQRPIGYHTFAGHFPQKSPIINGSFATNDLQLKGILWVFATLYLYTYTKMQMYMHVCIHCFKYLYTAESVCENSTWSKENDNIEFHEVSIYIYENANVYIANVYILMYAFFQMTLHYLSESFFRSSNWSRETTQTFMIFLYTCT